MKKFKGIFCALISSSTFGLIPLLTLPLIKDGEIGIYSILFYRFLFSTILMGAICFFQQKKLGVEKKSVLPMFVLSCFYAATALGLLYAYVLIPSGVATTIHFLYPIFVAFLMITFFKEKKSVVLFIAATISIVGVVVLCWNGTDGINLLGVLLALFTVVTYALYIVGINQSKTGRIDAEILTFYILMFGAVIFFIIALATTGIEPIPNNLSSWLYLLALAVFPTVVSDLTLIIAIKYAGSTVTSILGSMEPLVSVLVGVLYFHEHFDVYTLLGFMLIIVSVVLIIAFSRKAEVKPA